MSVFFDPFRSLSNEPFGQNFGSGLAAGGDAGLYPDTENLLAWYRTDIIDSKLRAYLPPSSHTTQQVKSSGFAGAGSATVTDLTTAHTFTATGDLPTCSVNGTLTFPGPDCWDVRAFLDGVLWAYWPGINVGQATELDASGNGHHLTGLVGTTITERTDGSGTNYKNESGFASCIAAPDGFTYPAELPDINIIVTDGVASVVGYDISAGRPTGKKYYVSTTGSDANDGLTELTPKKSIGTTIQIADAVEVYVQAGVYYRANAWNAKSPANDVSVIAVGGTVVSTYQDLLTWSADPTYPTVSKATRSSVYEVRDGSVLDSDGDAEFLVLRGSVEEVSLNPGSWYTDNVSVWVLPTNSRTADADIWAIMAAYNGKVSGKSCYVEGFEFRGGYPFRADNASAGGYTTARLKNCKFKYGHENGSGGFSTLGNVASILESCEAAENRYDGFNYHSNAAFIPVAIEINCTGRDNGTTHSSEIHNGSTMHNAGTIIRVGGEHYGNFGPNVIDVTESASWNIGVSAHNSTAVTSNADFYIDGLMWLHSCSGDIFQEESAGDVMYSCNTTTPGAVSTPYNPTAGLAIPIVFGGDLVTPGPLGIDATVTAGTVYPAVTIQAPLGAEFQAIPEFTGEAEVDLETFVPDEYVRTGPKGALVYRAALTAAGIIRADRVVGA